MTEVEIRKMRDADVPAAMVVLGTNTDIDTDGMFDVWEFDHGLNPLNSLDAWFDSDFDLYINLKLETLSISKGGDKQSGTVEVLAYGTAIRY